MVSALAHADEQLVDGFSGAALILDLKIKLLDRRKLRGGFFHLLSLCSLMSPARTNDHSSELLSEGNTVK